nr:bromo adjacent homology (BAH) domain protein [Tanacetum cinerariifolium]
MDDNAMSIDQSGEKRALENESDRELGHHKKKMKLGHDSNVKKVAEIVLVLSAMAKIRGGRRPSDVEVEMMNQAKENLVRVCEKLKPSDVFDKEHDKANSTGESDDEGVSDTIFGDNSQSPCHDRHDENVQETTQHSEDPFGLYKLLKKPINNPVQSRFTHNGGYILELLDDMIKIGVAKLSISERMQVTKQKMEKSDALHANTYASSRLQSNVGVAAAPNSGRMFPSDKAIPASISSGNFKHPANAVHAAAANPRALPYQLPTSEVRPGVSNSLPGSRAHFKIDGGANGSPYPQPKDHMTGKTSTWSKADGLSDPARGSSQGIASRPFTTQPNVNQQRMNFNQASDTHSEVSKIVQKILYPHPLDHPTWNPPSRDYMNKPLSCQMCKSAIIEVDTALVCDACERGYHLKCLQCNPKSIPKGDWQEWHCAKCLALSNGKPLPPKYGRVMRNITPKLSSNSVAAQPSLDKKMQSSDVNASQQTMTSANSVSHSASGGIAGHDSRMAEMPAKENQEHNTDKVIERSNDEKFTNVSESQPPANLDAVTSLSGQLLENHHSDNHTIVRSVTNDLAKQSQDKSLLSNAEDISSNGVIKDEQGISVKTNETSTVISEPEDLSSSIMHEVEWVGDKLQKNDGKTYYQSCSINGTVYKVKDYALFSTPGNKHLPNKLQAMWEDDKTTKKWVNVTRCFFPDDLPEGVGRPCAPESNEVYESNHESTLAAGLIHGPCEVLPPSKFAEETGVRTRSRARGGDRSKALFLSKWFYDETKRLFRDVTC